MVHQVFVVLSLHLVVLKALSQEEDALEGEDLLASISEVVAADLDLVFELGSVLGMEWCLSVKKLKQDDTNGPDVSLVRIVGLLNYLGSHVKRRSANGFVNLIEPFQFL